VGSQGGNASGLPSAYGKSIFTKRGGEGGGQFRRAWLLSQILNCHCDELNVHRKKEGKKGGKLRIKCNLTVQSRGQDMTMMVQGGWRKGTKKGATSDMTGEK